MILLFCAESLDKIYSLHISNLSEKFIHNVTLVIININIIASIKLAIKST